MGKVYAFECFSLNIGKVVRNGSSKPAFSNRRMSLAMLRITVFSFSSPEIRAIRVYPERFRGKFVAISGCPAV